MAIDNGIPLITDIKCAKLFIEVSLFFSDSQFIVNFLPKHLEKNL